MAHLTVLPPDPGTYRVPVRAPGESATYQTENFDAHVALGTPGLGPDAY
jgi:hypothetical protein